MNVKCRLAKRPKQSSGSLLVKVKDSLSSKTWILQMTIYKTNPCCSIYLLLPKSVKSNNIITPWITTIISWLRCDRVLDLKLRCCHRQHSSFPMVATLLPACFLSCALLPISDVRSLQVATGNGCAWQQRKLNIKTWSPNFCHASLNWSYHCPDLQKVVIKFCFSCYKLKVITLWKQWPVKGSKLKHNLLCCEQCWNKHTQHLIPTKSPSPGPRWLKNQSKSYV